MAQIYITRHIPDIGINLLRAAGHTVDVSQKDGVLTNEELKKELSGKPYDAVVTLLTDTINKDIFAAVPTAKIFANYAVGYNNINLNDASEAGVTITNTPGVLNNSVAEYTMALIMAVAKRITEAETFIRSGKYVGWAPELLLGTDIKGKTLGILGVGRIGQEVARKAHLGFDMKIMYNDVAPHPEIEKELGALYKASTEEVLREADIVSIHVPLVPETTHLINAERLALMKPSAYLINTSRGPVIDENALVDALRKGVIKGAGLDVFEFEPKLAHGLAGLSNVVITPHIASATEGTRNEMSQMVAQNILDFLAGETPTHVVRA